MPPTLPLHVDVLMIQIQLQPEFQKCLDVFQFE